MSPNTLTGGVNVRNNEADPQKGSTYRRKCGGESDASLGKIWRLLPAHRTIGVVGDVGADICPLSSIAYRWQSILLLVAASSTTGRP